MKGFRPPGRGEVKWKLSLQRGNLGWTLKDVQNLTGRKEEGILSSLNIEVRTIIMVFEQTAWKPAYVE